MVTTLKPRRSRASERAAKRYSTDLSDQEWQVIRPLLPPHPIGRGRKREVDEREILNAISYQIHNGCIWSASTIAQQVSRLTPHARLNAIRFAAYGRVKHL